MKFNKYIFTFTFLATFAGQALAGPFAAAIGSWLVNAVISMAISAVISSVFGGKKSSARGGQDAQGMMVNKQGSNDPIPVIYGRMRVGGTRAYIETSDGAGNVSGTKFLNIVLSMCEGRMGTIEQVYFNDIVIWKHTSVGGSGTLTNVQPGAWQLGNYETTDNKYSSANITIVYHEGTAGQPKDNMIQASVGSGVWTDNHKLSGVAYLAVKMEAKASVFQGGVPLITAVMSGKYIPDVSTINTGDTSFTTADGADANPVDVLYDYMTNPMYGKGLDHVSGAYVAGTDIDLTSFKAARDYAKNRYKINGSLDTTDKLYENIQELLDSFNGLLVYTSGKYKLQIRQPAEVSKMLFTTENIIGNIQIAGGVKRYRLNKITTQWRNPATDYNDDTLIVEDTAYLAQDSDTVLEISTDNRLITSESILQTISQWKLDNSRYQMTINFVAPHTALTLECGDIITITHEAAGWTAKPFRLMMMNITPDNTVEISAQEYISDIQV